MDIEQEIKDIKNRISRLEGQTGYDKYYSMDLEKLKDECDAQQKHCDLLWKILKDRKLSKNTDVTF